MTDKLPKEKVLIEIKDLQKTYKGRTVLDVPSFAFESGKHYCFIGANGSGKSTLLRLLAGAIQPTRGEIRRHFEPGQMAYLPQKPYTFSFSAERNLTMVFPASLAAGEKKQRSESLLREVGIEKLAKSKGNRLSGGEAQRLAIARLLAAPHRLLLLDEPSSATDIAGNELIEGALRRYCGECGAQIIFASHALSQAQRLADEIVFFAAGHIVEHGPTEQLLHDPQSEELRVFLKFWQG